MVLHRPVEPAGFLDIYLESGHPHLLNIVSTCYASSSVGRFQKRCNDVSSAVKGCRPRNVSVVFLHDDANCCTDSDKRVPWACVRDAG